MSMKKIFMQRIWKAVLRSGIAMAILLSFYGCWNRGADGASNRASNYFSGFVSEITSLFLPASEPAPVILKYCDKIDFSLPVNRYCAENRTLNIPLAYFNRTLKFNNPPDPDDWNGLTVAYPTMEPWINLSKEARTHAQELTILIIGKSDNNLDQIFWIGNAGQQLEKKAFYGLVWYPQKYMDGMNLKGPSVNPQVAYSCTRRFGDPRFMSGNCSAFTFTNWKLKLAYFFPQRLLPEWEELNSKVLGLIDSFIVP